MIRSLFIFFLLTILPAKAGLIIAGGMTSAMSGRPVPALHTGLMFQNFAITMYSSGVRSPIYFHNAYQLGIMGIFNPGKLLWGEWSGGFGLGGYVGIKGYRNAPGDSAKRHYDWAAGPVGRVQWNFAGPVFVALEVLLGLRSPWLHLLLSYQDVAAFSVGLRL